MGAHRTGSRAHSRWCVASGRRCSLLGGGLAMQVFAGCCSGPGQGQSQGHYPQTLVSDPHLGLGLCLGLGPGPGPDSARDGPRTGSAHNRLETASVRSCVLVCPTESTQLRRTAEYK